MGRAWYILVFLAGVALADGNSSDTITQSVVGRLQGMDDDRVTGPLRGLLCGPNRPDGITLFGGLDFAQLLPGTRASGASVSLNGMLRIFHRKGADHIEVVPRLMPSAGYTVPVAGASAATRVVPVDAGIGVSFNCVDNPNQNKPYFLSVSGAGFPFSFGFAIDAEILFTNAFLAADATNRPRDYATIMSRAQAADRYSRAHADLSRGAPLNQSVPRWQDGPAASVAHWVAETAKAAESAASKQFARRVEDYLARLKRGATDPLEKGRLHLEAADLQDQILQETSKLAHATFPLVISADRRALLKRVTDIKPKYRWYGSPNFRYHPTDSQIASYCRNNPHRFFGIYLRPKSRHYLDCVDNVVLSEAAYRSTSRALEASRAVVEKADRQRAALGDLFHLVNNSHARYLAGQAVRPESMTVGGIHRGKAITGCFALSVSAKDLIRSGSALLRGGVNLATQTLGAGPVSPSGLVGSLTRNAAGLGLPTLAPSVSLGYFYEIGPPVRIPLWRLPQSWQDLVTGRCGGETASGAPSQKGASTH